MTEPDQNCCHDKEIEVDILPDDDPGFDEVDLEDE